MLLQYSQNKRSIIKDVLCESARNILRDADSEPGKASEAIRIALKKECPAAFSIELFSAEFCAMLLDEMENVRKLIPTAPFVSIPALLTALNPFASNQNYMGLYLNTLGFDEFMREFTVVVNKLVAQRVNNIELAYTHSSIVKTAYHPKHTDIAYVGALFGHRQHSRTSQAYRQERPHHEPVSWQDL